MSGHSRWANIKHRKAKGDAAKASIFTKIGREIAVAVKAGGPDPAQNSRLWDVLAKARENNIPNDNIQRSIKKAAGELGTINYEDSVYEGYGPNGVAVIVQCLTDNKNRTAGDIRHIFDKSGGSMGTTGCVSFMFDIKGVVIVDAKPGVDDDEMMMTAIDLGADDFLSEDGRYEILCAPAVMSAVRKGFEGIGMNVVSAEVRRIPQNTVALSAEDAEKIERMLERFEDNDDVQEVFHNAELPESEDDDE
ncbi:MAG: YebC/PmpR family DNA-binding transcriptional regulator [Clostridiales bacterium]|jgi:YebC/PmpR family DNA-binding regulatory protein|nr:YebC/PmpR family DNA-binding transcriptional regulator [Clostridiales bacterium]